MSISTWVRGRLRALEDALLARHARVVTEYQQANASRHREPAAANPTHDSASGVTGREPLLVLSAAEAAATAAFEAALHKHLADAAAQDKRNRERNGIK